MISEVLVKANDKVFAGEPLIRLDDEEARARVATAQAQVAMRKRARNDQGAGKGADRRKAEDAVADAEAALVQARDELDSGGQGQARRQRHRMPISRRRVRPGAARRSGCAQKRAQLRKLEDDPNTPLPTANEGQLNVARGELRAAYAALEKLTVRAPIAGTVLQVNAKAGELAAPSAPQPLVLLGDLRGCACAPKSTNATSARSSSAATVRGPRRRVSRPRVCRQGRRPSRRWSSRRASTRAGQRNLTDFSVVEVLIELADPGPLAVGMKVDVYFQHEVAAQ